MNEQRSGILFSFGAFIIWGLFPLYWKMLDHVISLEVLLSRVIWSFIITTIVIVLIGQRKKLIMDMQYLWTNKKQLLSLFLASIFISFNWFTFIWVVQNNDILQSSLAYYINPLLSVLFGVLFFKERLSKAVTLSVFIAAAGVLFMIFSIGIVPWAAFIMASSFGIYGVLKKTIKLDALRGLAIETLLIFPFAIIFYIYLYTTGETAFLQIDIKTDSLLVLSGVLTALPLLFFAIATQKIPLYMVGFMQYLTPTLSLLIGVFIYKEPFTHVQLVTFGLIWLAIGIFSTASYTETLREKRQLVRQR